MNNHQAWEREYQDPQFLSLGTEPLGEVKDLIKWLKKQIRTYPEQFPVTLPDFSVLDLGCGNGKNLNYIVEHFAQTGIGYDISETAIKEARKAAPVGAEYAVRSIADPFLLSDKSVDLVLDVTASNSLSEKERGKFLKEISRVLKPGSYLFTRALCRDGDTNAKNLIKQFPGTEKDTYVLGTTGITERAFSKEDLLATYEPYFEIVHLEKTTGYQRWNNQSYKRNYWIMYAKLKA